MKIQDIKFVNGFTIIDLNCRKKSIVFLGLDGVSLERAIVCNVKCK